MSKVTKEYFYDPELKILIAASAESQLSYEIMKFLTKDAQPTEISDKYFNQIFSRKFNNKVDVTDKIRGLQKAWPKSAADDKYVELGKIWKNGYYLFSEEELKVSLPLDKYLKFKK
jgi:hypothetical protein